MTLNIFLKFFTPDFGGYPCVHKEIINEKTFIIVKNSLEPLEFIVTEHMVARTDERPRV